MRIDLPIEARVRVARPKAKKKGPNTFAFEPFENNPGSVLLSHTASRAVPSAPKSLTSEFGMGSGVASSKSPPEIWGSRVLAGARRRAPRGDALLRAALRRAES